MVAIEMVALVFDSTNTATHPAALIHQLVQLAAVHTGVVHLLVRPTFAPLPCSAPLQR